MKKILMSGLTAVLAAFILFVQASVTLAEETLLIYTAVEPEWLPKYKKAFEKINPDISIHWLREGTGTLTARLLAEKKSPKADAIFGLPSSSLLVIKSEGMLEPYTPKNFDDIAPEMRDSQENPCWVGIDAWASAICANVPELKNHGLAIPSNWEDLLRPEYRGLIVMPDPAASGTGYMNLVAWISLWGEEKAWAYADALNAQLKMLSPSGPHPAAMAAQGEIPIGISSGAFAAPLLKRHAPLKIVVPQNTGWEIEACAIVKGTKKLEAAQKFMDFTCSEAVAQLGAEFSGMPARTDFVTDKISMERLAPINLQWAADNRGRLLKLWRERYQH